MGKKKDIYFWEILEKYNSLMKEAIESPDCTDPKNCQGDCCSIKIDVPKILAEEYIERGYAQESDFIRSNVFTFYLRFSEKTGKCFLFSKELNGCSVHNSGIKPPQCWIYPTNFSNPSNKSISCKRLDGWVIKDEKKTFEAEKLLKKYIFLCQIEERKERCEIQNRIKQSKYPEKLNSEMGLKESLKTIAPSKLGGFKDSWNEFKSLSAEGYSLQMKKFCAALNPKCEFGTNNFLECKHICETISLKLIEYFEEHILEYIRINGADSEGEYPLFKLFNSTIK